MVQVGSQYIVVSGLAVVETIDLFAKVKFFQHMLEGIGNGKEWQRFLHTLNIPEDNQINVLVLVHLRYITHVSFGLGHIYFF